MESFPAIDPIPLPAPVWFFKTLLLAFLSLHFVAVHLVLGGLLIGLLWNLAGRLRKDAVLVQASGEVVHVLPIVMTYLINLGVPPLLFTQVLYGVALYTSSVLIGAWWISVIFILMAMYYVLYVSSLRAAAGRAWWGFGIVALLLGAVVGKIYSSNMTLMLRPEVWLDMFRSNPHGTGLPHGDPTLFWRWAFMMTGSLTIAGLGLVVLGVWKNYESQMKEVFVRRGGLIVAVGVALQSSAAVQVFLKQPDAVRARLVESGVYHPLGYAWLALAAAVFVVGLLAASRGVRASGRMAFFSALAGILLCAATVVYRDGIRDATFLIKGYDVWNRHVVVNLQVIAIFLSVLVVGLVLLGWIVAVTMKARPAVAEIYNGRS
jgi:hypothetical protein